MTNIKSWLSEHVNRSKPQQPSIDIKELRLLLCHVLKKDQAWLFSHTDFELNSSHISHLNYYFIQLTQGKPLAYITGTQAFWDFELSVNENTLIPRSDTETLIETCISLLQNKPPETILDLGTGTGAIAIALAKNFNRSQITAVDASHKALETAKKNCEINNISNIQLIKSDWFKSIDPQQFNLIVSNPPYIADGDIHLKNLTHEPIEALVAADNGLADFKTIASNAMPYLSNGGLLIFEHGWQQKVDVQNIFEQRGFTHIESFKDLSGNDRITCGHKK